jgi:crotonobetainyl-CoA:carnitine CoA-transferase CaiB-like acyl-CoA transferase
MIESDAPPAGALDGVRVVDLTTVLMGPFATQLLADLGADVVKIEPPAGDSTRHLGASRHPGMGPTFLHVNRNKRSVVMDLKHPEAHAALLKLVERADVLVYNVRPQALARLGLTWDALSKINPRLIHAGVFGFAQDGPYAAKPAYDDLIQGAIGVPSLVAAVGDGTPRYVPVAMIDRTVGMAAVNAICAALYRREKTGVGQALEVPMFETMVPFVLGEHFGGATFEPPAGPYGYARLLARDRTPFPTRDGHVCTVIYSDKQWRSFFAMIGEPERCTTDPRYADIATRTRYIDEIYAEVAALLKTRTTAEWLELLAAADIPAMPLHTLESLSRDPHLVATGYFAHTVHPSEGAILEMRPATRFSESPATLRRPAPRFGEHTAEILAEAGYSADGIAALAACGAVRLAD